MKKKEGNITLLKRETTQGLFEGAVNRSATQIIYRLINQRVQNDEGIYGKSLRLYYNTL